MIQTNNKLLLIASREFLATVRKPSFWLSTLALPVFIVVIGFVSGLSSQVAEQQEDKIAEEKSITIIDETAVISNKLLPPNITLGTDFEAAKTRVRNQELYAAILVPADLFDNGTIQVYSQSDSIFSSGGLTELTNVFIRQSLLESLDDSRVAAAVNTRWQFETTLVDANGREVPDGISRLVAPGLALIIYVVLSTFATSYLLRSVSEEKENRMIEVVLAAVTPRQLVWGKVLGQLGIVITQLITLIILSLAALAIMRVQLPADLLSNIYLPFPLLVVGLILLIAGFLTMAGIMVLAASAVPTYREAQSFSSVFIILSIFPVYFITAIIAEPNGVLAQICSLLPLTSPLIMLIRVFLIDVPTGEIIAAIILNIIYILIIFVAAFKIFELGALEYNRAITWRQLGVAVRKFLRRNRSQPAIS